MDIFLLIFTLVAAAVMLPAYFFVLRYNLHMFQLNGYKNGEHANWIKKNINKQLILFVLAALGIVEAIIPQSPKEMAALQIVLCSLLIVISLIIIKYYLYLKRVNNKKKLVYTARVKRLVTTDSIINIIIAVLLAVFLPKGVYALPGVLAFLAAFHFAALIVMNTVNKPIEKSINNYYINDAKKMLESNRQIKVIGVTGSYGKTSVKYYLHTLLQEHFNVLITPESYNTPMGVVKTIRSSLKPTHELFICEMGARHVGDIKEICDIVHPDMGVITSIGPQHLETFFNMENIVSTKYELGDALPEGGMLFLNGDNEYVSGNADKYKTKTFYRVNSKGAGYHAENIKLTQTGTDFTVVAPSGEKENYHMKLVGAHNVINVVGAIAVANTLGVKLSDLIIPVRRILPVAHRLELLERGNVTIIDDAYNSNPVGSKAAVETLNMFDGVRILVTPGMVELGDKEEEYNYKFGTYAAANCDYVLLVGAKHTEPIKKGVLDSGFDENKCKVYDTLQEALAYAYTIKDEGHKFILLENDLTDNY